MAKLGLAAALLVIGLASAAAEPFAERLVSADEAPRWFGVGSLRVAGRRSCTAVLISPTEAVTAAHCVVDRASGRRTEPRYFKLVLGQGVRSYSAVRSVVATAFLPGFVSREPITDFSDLSADLALLRLDRPVTPTEAQPFVVADWPEPVGAFVDIVGYERDGPKAVTRRQGCLAVKSGKGVIVVTCEVITGLSGSPVLLDSPSGGPPQFVATVSSRSGDHAFVVAIAPRLAELRALIAK